MLQLTTLQAKNVQRYIISNVCNLQYNLYLSSNFNALETRTLLGNLKNSASDWILVERANS